MKLIWNIDRRSLARRAAAVCGLALLAGCSLTRFGYERLDWVARWQAGRYVSLTQQQETVFDDRFAEFWDWHRREELPLWIDELRTLAAQADDTRRVTRQKLAQMSERYGRSMQRMAQRLAPVACEVGPQLSDEQTEELLDAVDERIDEFRRQRVEAAPEDRRKAAIDAIEKPLRRWLGRITDEQQALIRDWQDRRPAVSPAWLAYRKAWRSELAATLKTRSAPDFCARATRLITDGSVLWTEDQRAIFTADREHWLDLFDALLPTLGEDQQRHVRRRLLGLAQDFEAVLPGHATAGRAQPAEPAAAQRS